MRLYDIHVSCLVSVLCAISFAYAFASFMRYSYSSFMFPSMATLIPRYLSAFEGEMRQMMFSGSCLYLMVSV